MTGQDSEQASGAASARTCARDAQVAHTQKPFWLGFHLSESGSFGLRVFQILASSVLFCFGLFFK